MKEVKSLALNEQNFIKIYNDLRLKNIVGEIFEEKSDNFSVYRFKCEWNNSISNFTEFGYGISENLLEAKFISLLEAIERYHSVNFNEKLFINNSFSNLTIKSINPKTFSYFSKDQLYQDDFKEFVLGKDDKFNWISGRNLFDNTEIMLPAQIVLSEYNFKKYKEKKIRIPISTGDAIGLGREDALIRGIFEIIERDNYMINFLNQIQLKKIINLENALEIKNLIQEIKSNGLKYFVLNATLDFNVNSIITLFLDESGNSPAVTVGLGCHTDLEKAIKKSILEAITQWLTRKEIYYENKNKSFLISDLDFWESYRKRTFWNSFINIDFIKKIINEENIEYLKLKEESNNYNDSNLENLKNEIKNKNYEAFYVDLSSEELKKHDLKVIKSIIPEMYPMFTDERYPYKNNFRLYNLPVELGKSKAKLKESEIKWLNPL